MEAKHTPGPWHVVGWVEENTGPVRNIANAAGCTLAFIQHCAEDKANARLMAAAPDLLAALLSADLAMANGGILASHAARKEIASAIAKATGETS